MPIQPLLTVITWACLAANLAGQSSNRPQVTMDSAEAQPWWQRTVVYQIYPRSFQDTNGDGIGDLQGIIQRLDYLQALGVETLWISPFFASPQADFGYDIAAYDSIAPEYGTRADVEALLDSAHRRGLRVVFDLVMNHTSNQHPWFKASEHPSSPYHHWYTWHQGRGRNGRKPPTNWKSMTGGSGWHRHPETGLWYWAMFLPFQPDLNYYHPAVRQHMLGVARHWLSLGVDGFRLDIFNCLYEDSLFRNNPPSLRPLPSENNPNGLFQQFRHQLNHPRTLDFAERLRALVDSFAQHPVLIGEVFGPLSATRRYLGEAENNRLSLAFAFQTVSMRYGARYWHRMTQELERVFSPPFMPTYVFSNHDRTRSLYRLNGDLRKARLLALYQLTVRGVPVIYMGEELGVNQASELPIAQARDPLARKYAHLPRWIHTLARRKTVAFNRDECRTPMPWSGNLPNAGFSSGQPWLPLQQDWKRTNAAAQTADSTRSLLGFYQRALAVRRATPALQHGRLESLARTGRHGLCYRRTLEGQPSVTIILNTGSQPLRLPTSWVPAHARAILTTGSPWPAIGTPTHLPPYTGWVLQSL